MDYLISIFTITSYTLIAIMGVHIINGMTGQLSLAHAGFWCIGAYTAGVIAPFLVKVGLPNIISSPVLILSGLAVVYLVAKIFSLIIFKLKGDYFAVGTLCFSEIVRITIMNIDSLGGPRGIHNIPTLTNMAGIIFYTTLAIFLTYRLGLTKWARSFKYIKDDEMASESVGLSIKQVKTSSFVISAMFVGTSGILFASHQNTIKPDDFNLNVSINFILMILVGGQGYLRGAVLGAIILSTLPEGLRFFGSEVSSWRVSIFSILLIFLMLFRPQGIITHPKNQLIPLKN